MGNFFVLNLFVGVVIDNFNEMKEILSGTSMLSEEQKQWIEIHKLFLKSSPEKLVDPPLGWRKQVYIFVNWKPFDLFITICIVLNIVAMAVKTYNSDSMMEEILT